MGEAAEQHIFIIGSKGIPARYGGFETFVDQLVRGRKSPRIQYHVACLADNNHAAGETFHTQYAGADCFSVWVINIGPAKAVLYDLLALRHCLRYIRQHQISRPIVYILACRIGPFVGHYARQLHRLGGQLFVNPDGHEWKRRKWNRFIRRYWKLSEGKMVKYADLLVCDSKAIEQYIRKEYHRYTPATCYISYGASLAEREKTADTTAFGAWCRETGVSEKDYYLSVGRLVPENNYEQMLREFMASETDKSFVLITSTDNRYYETLRDKTGFSKDRRILFPGTVYDQALLAQIRQQAFAYIHGHEVGGTNPSLLEALAYTDVNLLFDVPFNREVAEDAAVYWGSQPKSLRAAMQTVESLSPAERASFGVKAKSVIETRYHWPDIISQYEALFEDFVYSG